MIYSPCIFGRGEGADYCGPEGPAQEETAPGATLKTAVLIVLLGILSAIASPLCSRVLAKGIPSPAHVIVVMEENHGYSEIIVGSHFPFSLIGWVLAPYIHSLAVAGASFTNAHAIAHPSQPNYLALFSGSTQGITNDSCPYSFAVPNLESELIAAKLTFAGYSEGLPSTGSEVCSSGNYARKHVPWTDFSDDPPSNNRPLSNFPTNFADLPTVSWVIPDQVDDMHSGSIRQADSWLRNHLSGYVAWAQNNNGLLIIDWDEDQGTSANHIPTIFVGPMVKPGQYDEKIDHYSVLRTIEDMYRLPHLGHSAAAAPIMDVWQ